MAIDRAHWRIQILNIIESQPGIQSREIRSMVDPNRDHDRCIVAHCLTRLFRDGYVQRERVKGESCLTYAYFPHQERKGMKIKNRLVSAVKKNPGLTAAQLAPLLGLNNMTARGLQGHLGYGLRTGELWRRKDRTNRYIYFSKDFHPDGLNMNSSPADFKGIAATAQLDAASRFNAGITLAAQLCSTYALEPSISAEGRAALADMAKRIEAMAI